MVRLVAVLDQVSDGAGDSNHEETYLRVDHPVRVCQISPVKPDVQLPTSSPVAHSEVDTVRPQVTNPPHLSGSRVRDHGLSSQHRITDSFSSHQFRSQREPLGLDLQFGRQCGGNVRIDTMPDTDQSTALRQPLQRLQVNPIFLRLCRGEPSRFCCRR